MAASRSSAEDPIVRFRRDLHVRRERAASAGDVTPATISANHVPTAHLMELLQTDAMPRKKRKKRNRPDRDPQAPSSVEALTAVWAMSVMTTLTCDVVAALARLYYLARPAATRIGLLSDLLFFSAAVIGLVTLILTLLVVRARGDNRPPPGFVLLAWVVSLAPLAAMLVKTLR